MNDVGCTTNAQIRMIASASVSLGKELRSLIVNNLMEHAGAIRQFGSRRDELMSIDDQYVFYLSMAAMVYHASWKRRWDSVEAAAICKRLSRLMASQLRYESPGAGEGDFAAAETRIMDRLLHEYENFSHAMERIRAKDPESEASQRMEWLYFWFMRHLSLAYPPFMEVLNNMELGSVMELGIATLLPDFGLVLMAGGRHLPTDF